jgi:hypothetical protein
LKVQIVPFEIISQLQDKSQIIEQEEEEQQQHYYLSKQVLNGHRNLSTHFS